MKIFCSILLCLFAISITAQQSNQNWYPLIEGSLHYGGDELATISFTNGEEQTMRAGQGGALAVGFEFRNPSDRRLRGRGGVGIKYNTTAAENVNIRFTRFPLFVTSQYQTDMGFRFGAGISYHIAPKFKGDSVLPDVDLNSGLGRRIEIGYKWVAVVAEFIKYNIDGAFEDIDGFSIGIAGSYAFGGE